LEYVGVFAALSFSGVLFLVFRGVFLAIVQLNASLNLHQKVLNSIIGAPIAFFDVTPLG
jgi:hypothetical protein